MFRKLILVVFCLLLSTVAFADNTFTLDNYDVSGAQARHTFLFYGSATSAATAMQPLAIPQGAKTAGLVIKGGTWEFSGGDILSGDIRDASFTINLHQSAGILHQVSGSASGTIPVFSHNIAAVSETAAQPWVQTASFVQSAFSSPGLYRYGSYQIPVEGFRFMQVLYHVEGDISAYNDATKTIFVDFND